MNPVAQFALIGTVPFVLTLFATFPPRKALIISYVVNWLILPNSGFVVIGLPDFTKVTATNYGAVLGVLIFDPARLWRFRPRWFDLPIAVYCVGPVATAYSNDLTLYDGLTSLLDMATTWGLPYFLGRLYINDLEGLRELAQAIFVGGLTYVPVCFLESRLSPFLQKTIYNVQPQYEAARMGSFRPLGFMTTGLELAMYMISASLAGFWLWKTGAMKPVMGIGQGRLIIVLLIATVFTKSFGALSLLLVGLGILLLVQKTKSPIPVLVLLAIPILYMYPRTMELWSGRGIVEIAKYVNTDRASSLEYRMDMEDILAKKAMQRPCLGWGGYGRYRVYDETGRDLSVPDGFWIISLGMYGLVGLSSVTLIHMLPGLTLLRKYPARRWAEPEVAPAAVLALTLGLYMVDNLSNAMYNPIYILTAGGLLSIPWPRAASQSKVAADRLELGKALHQAGHTAEAEAVLALSAEDLEAHVAGGQGVEASDLHYLAETYDALAPIGMSRAGGGENGVAHLRRAAELRNVLASSRPGDVETYRGLALEFETLGRALWREGKADEADEAWLASIEVRRSLVEAEPESEAFRREWADAHNDFAWLLARKPRPGFDDTARAADLAAQALGVDPESSSYWNTLGVARFASGDFPGAVEAVSHSVELSHGGNGYDHYVLAMAYHYLGQSDHAFGHFQIGESWAAANPANPDLALLRSEAVNVLSVTEGVEPLA